MLTARAARLLFFFIPAIILLVVVFAAAVVDATVHKCAINPASLLAIHHESSMAVTYICNKIANTTVIPPSLQSKIILCFHLSCFCLFERSFEQTLNEKIKIKSPLVTERQKPLCYPVSEYKKRIQTTYELGRFLSDNSRPLLLDVSKHRRLFSVCPRLLRCFDSLAWNSTWSEQINDSTKNLSFAMCFCDAV